MPLKPGRTTIDLWVPGPWRDMHDLRGIDVDGCDLKLLSRNSALADWMDAGSGGAFAAQELGRIRDHVSIASVRLGDSGDRLASELLSLANALNNAGGLGIRVAKCGLAHPWTRWDQLLNSDPATGVNACLVLQVTHDERGRLDTFGMNQFALADASVELGTGADRYAPATAFAFNVYLRTEKPKLKDGATFSYDPDAPSYVLAHEADDRYAATDPYYNPQGVWCLMPIDD